MYEANLIFIQVLLSLVIGIWIGLIFKDTKFMQIFEKNNWIVGLFLIVIGWVNFRIYEIAYLKNANLILIIVGLIIVLTFLWDAMKKK